MPAITAGQRGSATVEHAALVVLIGLLASAVILAVAGARGHDGALLGSAIARKQRCAVRYPDPCWQDPLTDAYGRSVAGAVRALAPAPEARIGPDGEPLVGVDYRRCRQPSCATALPGVAGLHLTASNRRTAAFTAVRDERRSGGGVDIDYWIYRPTLGWELIRRHADPATLTGTASTKLNEDADPVLIPLEMLLGRDDASFRAGEEPPWRGMVESLWGR